MSDSHTAHSGTKSQDQTCGFTDSEGRQGFQPRVQEWVNDCMAWPRPVGLEFGRSTSTGRDGREEKTSAPYLQRIAWLIPNVRAPKESLSSELIGATVPSMGSWEIPIAADLDSSFRF